MKLSRFKWALSAAALALSASAFAAPPTPAMISNACAGCHGTNGASAGPSMPSLARQNKESIVTAIKKFKSGEGRAHVVVGQHSHPPNLAAVGG